MKTDVAARVSNGRQKQPSALLLWMIVAPTMALVLALIVWAYLVHDWKWFALLIFSAIGVIFYLVSPQLFSIRDDYSEREWRLTMSPPPERARVSTPRPSTTGRAAGETTPKAPNRTA